MFLLSSQKIQKGIYKWISTCKQGVVGSRNVLVLLQQLEKTLYHIFKISEIMKAMKTKGTDIPGREEPFLG